MSTDSTADDPKIPKIEFPCVYPIKIIGVASETFQQLVIAAVERHSGKIEEGLIKVRPSREHNYLAVTVAITATGEKQLSKIFEDLKTIDDVKMVL